MSRLFERPIAHRGLHDRANGIIENTRAAFEAAIAKDYAIECDVQLSSDGVPFIFHDDNFERLTSATGRSDAMPIANVQNLVLTGSTANERSASFQLVHSISPTIPTRISELPTMPATASLRNSLITPTSFWMRLMIEPTPRRST